MILSRRNFLVGLIAAPAIVRVASIMPVRPIDTWTVVCGETYPEELFDYGRGLDLRAFLHPSQVATLNPAPGSYHLVQKIPGFG